MKSPAADVSDKEDKKANVDGAPVVEGEVKPQMNARQRVFLDTMHGTLSVNPRLL
mgnify:CR=1 FL=1